MKPEKSNNVWGGKQPTTGTKCGAVGEGNGKLVLASASPRRKDLLQGLGLQFEVVASNVEELVEPDMSPEQVVAGLAKQKALDVFKRLAAAQCEQQLLVLGADTIVVLDGQFLGKPVDKNDACSMLRQLSGRMHEVFTGIYLAAGVDGVRQTWNSVERSAVYFRHLSDVEIAAYVETGEPMDKAGSYALQGIGAALVDKIEGSPTNIVGLPIPNVVSLLRQAGYQILGLPES